MSSNFVVHGIGMFSRYSSSHFRIVAQMFFYQIQDFVKHVISFKNEN